MWSYLKTVQKPIVLYGMGNGADKGVSAAPAASNPRPRRLCKRRHVRGHQFHGFDVLQPQAVGLFGDMVVLLCFGSAAAGSFGAVPAARSAAGAVCSPICRSPARPV